MRREAEYPNPTAASQSGTETLHYNSAPGSCLAVDVRTHRLGTPLVAVCGFSSSTLRVEKGSHDAETSCPVVQLSSSRLKARDGEGHSLWTTK